MRFALLHYTFWPEIGGVENVMRDQANLLRRAGHTVKVLTGVGSETGDDYELAVLPELAPEFELNAAVRAVLDRGQSDQNFNKYRSILVEVLGAHFADADVVIVHNVFTMHLNLALTMALHDLATAHRLIAWTHDLVATNSDFALPNPKQPPWSLMRAAASNVTYVATSEARAEEIRAHIKPAQPVSVVPNPVDPARIFGLTAEMRESLGSINLAERDFVFLLPARLMLRKNVEFALEVIAQLNLMERNPLLLITGAKGGGSAAERYADFLKQTIPRAIQGQVVFVSDFFPIDDGTLRDLYLLADCLLFPSRQEGFGLPIVEAALFRLPIWCSGVPAFWALEGEGAFQFSEISKLKEAIAWLEGLPTFRGQRKARRLFDPSLIYRDYYKPLFEPALL